MPLQIGIWNINTNGTVDQLQINGVDVNGNVAGTLAALQITGFWDEITQRLMFTDGISAYSGFMFSDQNRMPGIIGGNVLTLAGCYTSSGAAADQYTFGWYAQIGMQ